MKHRLLKRVFALAMSLCLVIGLCPIVGLADEEYSVGDEVTTYTDEAPAAVKGAVWVQTEASSPCYYVEHEHNDDCYKKSCDHKSGHLSTCYSSSTEYEVCTHADDSQHTGTFKGMDIYTITDSGIDWNTDHPAYSAAYKIYQDAYDVAYGIAYNKYMNEKLASLAGWTAGTATLAATTFCYTTTSEPNLCNHTCSEVGGDCYTQVCILAEHTHTLDCTWYKWVLRADVNNDGIADEDETQFGYVTVTAENATVTVNGAIYNGQVAVPHGEEINVTIDPNEEYVVIALTMGGEALSDTLYNYNNGIVEIGLIAEAGTNYDITAAVEKARLGLAGGAMDKSAVATADQAAVFEVVYRSSIPAVTADDVTVEYLALSIGEYEYWVAIDGEASLNSFLDSLPDAEKAIVQGLIGDDLPHAFGEQETETVRVTFSGNERYNGELSKTTKVDIVEDREQEVLTLADAEYRVTDLRDLSLDEMDIISLLVADRENGRGSLSVDSMLKYNETTNDYNVVYDRKFSFQYGDPAIKDFGKYYVTIKSADTNVNKGTTASAYLTIVDDRLETALQLNENVSFTWSEDLTEEDVYNAVFSALTDGEKNDLADLAVYGETMTIEIDGLNAGAHNATVKFSGTNTYAAAEAAVEVTIKQATETPVEPTEKPVPPTEESDPVPGGDSGDNREEKIPNTGDENHVGLWAALFLAAGSSMIALFPRKKNH